MGSWVQYFIIRPCGHFILHNGVEALVDVLEPVTPLGLAAALLDIPLVVGERIEQARQ